MKAFCRSYKYPNWNCRKISSACIAQLDPTIQEEDRFWVCTRGTFLHTQHTLLPKCAEYGAIMPGKAAHAQITHFGVQSDTRTSNILINLYSKCGLLNYARKVFDQMRVRTVVSWNTIIGAYSQNGSGQGSLRLFVRMLEGGFEFSEFALSSVLCACASRGLALESKQLHAFAVKSSMESNAYVGTALLDVYAKCGLISDAFLVFESMQEKSGVTWSSMIAGLVQNNLYEEAVALFLRARRARLESNMYDISSALSACAAMAAFIEGTQIHALVCKTGFGTNAYIASCLVDLYSKCGSIKHSYAVFVDLEKKNKNVVVWNTMISGFARHARPLEAMILFEKMQQEFLCPNDVSYVSVLSACAHMGLAQEGRKYFHLMTKEHGVLPNVFHYSCMVDILGRTGRIKEAKGLIDEMPFEATASMWGSLLASCRVYGNVEVAEVAAENLFEIEPHNAGNHVLLSNVYAARGRWKDVAASRKLLKASEAKKERGESWIAVRDKVHCFTVGEARHPRAGDVNRRLDEMVREMEALGYRSGVEHELHDVEDDCKRELLKGHSEKLAFAFGVMCLPAGVPVRIMKNLRICGDCHEFMKVASAATAREIVVRDNNRFHHFREGCCSCGDFW